jgi:hypothetical protein
LVNDEDVSELPCLLSEMTRHIPRIDDDDPIEHLRGGVEPVEDFHPSNGAGITGIVIGWPRRKRTTVST